jgi:hypothetical protein
MIVKNLKAWHAQVCLRDSYICQACFKDFNFPCFFLEDGRNAMVCGDHIKTQGSSPELKLETDNGRCICFSCHSKRHSKGL